LSVCITDKANDIVTQITLFWIASSLQTVFIINDICTHRLYRIEL